MKDKILSYISTTGPVGTTQVSRYFRIDSMYAGAYLSELVDSKKIKYTFKKVGGSPLYYVDSQKIRLESALNDQLNQREKDVVLKLKEKKILKEDFLDPVERVVVKDLKDFAVQIVVNYKNLKHVFWKWHMIPKEESESIIKDMFLREENKQEVDSKKIQIIQEPIKSEAVQKTEHDAELLKQQQKIDAEKQEKQQLEQKQTEQKENKQQAERQQKQDARYKETFDQIKRLQKENESFKQQIQKLQKEIDSLKSLFKSSIDEIKANIEQQKLNLVQKIKDSSVSESDEETVDELKNPSIDLNIGGFISFDDKKIDDEFLKKVYDYFAKDGIVIEKIKIIKPNSSMDLIVNIKTALGDIKYYCDVKNKKSVNDGDLSSAFLKGQLNNLPVLFVTSGKLTKKAESMLQNFKTMVVKQNILSQK